MAESAIQIETTLNINNKCVFSTVKPAIYLLCKNVETQIKM